MTKKTSESASVTPVDFSRSALEREMLWNILRDWKFTTPVAVGLVGGLAVFVAGAPWFTPLVALLGGGYFCKKFYMDQDDFINNYVTRQLEALRQATDAGTAQLRDELGRLECREGLKQLEALPKRVQSVEKVLNSKFPPSGYTYMRYAGATEQAKLTVLKQLRGIVSRLQSVEHIEGKSCNPRARGRDGSEVSEAECTMRDEQMAAVKDLLAQNEQVLTELSQLGVELARIDTDSVSAPPVDAVIGQLVQLARQAHSYDNK